MMGPGASQRRSMKRADTGGSSASLSFASAASLHSLTQGVHVRGAGAGAGAPADAGVGAGVPGAGVPGAGATTPSSRKEWPSRVKFAVREVHTK